MAEPNDVEARVRELEIRFTEQQRLIDDLSEVLIARQRQLDEVACARRSPPSSSSSPCWSATPGRWRWRGIGTRRSSSSGGSPS
jgi:uncharacterized cupin superfamily protein